MPDDADNAQDHVERELAVALRIRRPVPAPTGCCLWCDEPAPGRAYCSSECREDAEQAARFRR